VTAYDPGASPGQFMISIASVDGNIAWGVPMPSNFTATKEFLKTTDGGQTWTVAQISEASPEQLTHLIKLYEKHVEKYPERKEANVAYLMKAAEAARAKSDFKEAIAIYNRVIAEFGWHEKAARALFMKGYTYDNDLEMKDSAVVFYSTFLQRYPRSEFADDAGFLLENIGKTNAEIIEEFEKKQQAKGTSSKLSGE
jgi:TolA-binding protein